MIDADSLSRIDEMMPGVHPVVYWSQQSGDNQSSYLTFSVPRGRKKKISKTTQLIFDADLSTIMVIWEIFQASLDESTPLAPTPPATPTLTRLKRGDRIVDGDAVWLVMAIGDLKLLDNNWNLICQQLLPSM